MNNSYITVWVRADLVKYFFVGEAEGMLVKPKDNNYISLLVPYGNLILDNSSNCTYMN